jgi:hypothetical protein
MGWLPDVPWSLLQFLLIFLSSSVVIVVAGMKIGSWRQSSAVHSRLGIRASPVRHRSMSVWYTTMMVSARRALMRLLSTVSSWSACGRHRDPLWRPVTGNRWNGDRCNGAATWWGAIGVAA